MSGPETQRASNENWSVKIGRIFTKINGDIQKNLAENTSISDEHKQIIVMALDIDEQDVVSEILDGSTKYKGMSPEDRVRRVLTDRILKAVGTENVFVEDSKEPTAVANFLMQAVM